MFQELVISLDRYDDICDDFKLNRLEFYCLGYRQYFAIWRNYIIGVYPYVTTIYPICMISNWEEYKTNIFRVDSIHQVNYDELKDQGVFLKIPPTELYELVSGTMIHHGCLDTHLADRTYYMIKRNFISRVNKEVKAKKLKSILQN